MYKKILVATDGSEFAKTAVSHGVELAKSVGAMVVVVTVTQGWTAYQMAEKIQKGTANPIQEYVASMDELAGKILADSKATATAASVDCKVVHVSDGYPAEGIIETAQKQNCDLIVMASHGRRGLGRMLLGSQTTEVLGFSKIPVLVLR